MKEDKEEVMENKRLRRLGTLVISIVAIAITIIGINNYIDGKITIDRIITGILLSCFFLL